MTLEDSKKANSKKKDGMKSSIKIEPDQEIKECRWLIKTMKLSTVYLKTTAQLTYLSNLSTNIHKNFQ